LRVKKHRNTFALFFEVRGKLLDIVNKIPLLGAGGTAYLLNLMSWALLLILAGYLIKWYVIPPPPGVKVVEQET